MTFRTLKIVALVALYVLALEIALEFRAYRRGWDTLLFGTATAAPARKSGAGSEEIGPFPGFPFRSRRPNDQGPSGRTLYWLASSSHGQDIRLPASQIFPNVLRTLLEEDVAAPEVLNASRAGLTIKDNVRELRELGPKWRPSMVILYQGFNDIDKESVRWMARKSFHAPVAKEGAPSAGAPAPAPKSTWPNELVENTSLYALLKGNVTARLVEVSPLRSDFDARAANTLEESIRSFVRASTEIGAHTILCTFAVSHGWQNLGAVPPDTRHALFRTNATLSLGGWISGVDAYNASIRKVAADQGLPVADLATELGGHPEFFRDFSHFSPEGHRRVAGIIRRTIQTAPPPFNELAARR